MRMGSDKGLLVHAGEFWAAIALRKLTSLGIPAAISVNTTQEPIYRELLGQQHFITDNAALNVHGPLLGILSAHEEHPDEDLCILACDLLLIDHQILTELYDVYRKNPKHDAIIFTNNTQFEPMCGIYSAGGLTKIKVLLDHGELSRHSMRFVLSQLSVCEIKMTEIQRTGFKNFNDPAVSAE